MKASSFEVAGQPEREERGPGIGDGRTSAALEERSLQTVVRFCWWLFVRAAMLSLESALGSA